MHRNYVTMIGNSPYNCHFVPIEVGYLTVLTHA